MNLQVCAQTRQSLRDEIERCVELKTQGMIRGLRVDLAGDCYVISGRTGTYYSKQLATHAALSAGDAVSLTNNIEVC